MGCRPQPHMQVSCHSSVCSSSANCWREPAASGHHFCRSISTLEKEVVSGSTGNTYFPSQQHAETQFDSLLPGRNGAEQKTYPAHPEAYLKFSASGGLSTNRRSTVGVAAMWRTASITRHRVRFGTVKIATHEQQNVTVLCYTTTCCPALLAIAVCLNKSC